VHRAQQLLAPTVSFRIDLVLQKSIHQYVKQPLLPKTSQCSNRLAVNQRHNALDVCIRPINWCIFICKDDIPGLATIVTEQRGVLWWQVGLSVWSHWMMIYIVYLQNGFKLGFDWSVVCSMHGSVFLSICLPVCLYSTITGLPHARRIHTHTQIMIGVTLVEKKVLWLSPYNNPFWFQVEPILVPGRTHFSSRENSFEFHVKLSV
jgi:hypothetical protein